MKRNHFQFTYETELLTFFPFFLHFTWNNSVAAVWIIMQKRFFFISKLGNWYFYTVKRLALVNHIFFTDF